MKKNLKAGKIKRKNYINFEEEVVRLIEEFQNNSKEKIKEILRVEKNREISKEKNLDEKIKKDSKPKKPNENISDELYCQINRITPNYSSNFQYNFFEKSVDYEAIYKHMGNAKKDPFKDYLEGLRASLDNVGSKEPITAEEVEKIVKKNAIMVILSNINDMPSVEEKEKYAHWVMFNRYMNMIKMQLTGLGEAGSSYLLNV